MLNLTVNLPPPFVLVSIHLMHSGNWLVCVKMVKPGEVLGEAYGSAERADINEAARYAMERCRLNKENPPVREKPTVDIDLKELGL